MKHGALGVVAAAEVGQGGGDAAHGTGLGGKGDGVHVALLGHDGGHVGGDAHAQVGDAARLELHGAAAADDLPVAEGQLGQGVHGLADLAGEGGLEVDALGLPAGHGIGGLDHVVHQDAGDLHVVGVHGAGLGDVLHLDDDDAAAVLGGHGHGQALVEHALVLEGDVAVLVGGGAAEEGHMEGEALVEEVLLPLELHQLHQILGGGGIHLAALDPGIHKGAQAHLRQQAGPSGGDLPPEVDDHALGQAVALDLVLPDQLVEGEGGADVGARPAGDETFAGLTEPGDAPAAVLRVRALGAAVLVPAGELVAVAPVAHGAALLQVQVPGMARLLEAVPDGTGHLLGPAGKPHAGQAHRCPVGDQFCCFLRGNELCHTSYLPVRRPNLFIELVHKQFSTGCQFRQ